MNPILKVVLVGVCSLAIVAGFAIEVKTLPQIQGYRVKWEGATDIDMLHQVQADIKTAKALGAKKLVVDLVSPGGPVVAGLEIARLVRHSGIPVEIHANTLCASACTFVLAAGTPGQRYIKDGTLFLVHPMQTGSMFGAAHCVKYPTVLNDQDDRVTVALYDSMYDAYQEYTGKDRDTVKSWLQCGKETVTAHDDIAVLMGFADKVE